MSNWKTLPDCYGWRVEFTFVARFRHRLHPLAVHLHRGLVDLDHPVARVVDRIGLVPARVERRRRTPGRVVLPHHRRAHQGVERRAGRIGIEHRGRERLHLAIARVVDEIGLLRDRRRRPRNRPDRRRHIARRVVGSNLAPGLENAEQDRHELHPFG